jgi:hypothetical protein
LEDRRRIAEHLRTFIDNLPEPDYFRADLLKQALKMSVLTKGDTDRRCNLLQLVDFYQAQADEEASESKLNAVSSLSEASRYLEQLRDPQQEERLEDLQRKRTELLASEEGYQTVTHEVKIEPSHVAEFLQEHRTAELPAVLAPSAFLVGNMPSEVRLQRHIEELRSETPLLFLISHLPIWPDGVTEYHAQSEQEIFEYHRWSHAAQWLRLVSIYLGILIDELEDHEWGLEQVISAIEGSILIDPERLPNLKHAFAAYFNDDFRTAVILLTLEIEPLLRGILRRLGLATTKHPRNEKSTVQRVKYIEECFATPEIKKLLGEQWIIAAKALLTHDGGEKLRHRVAHGRNIENVIGAPVAHVLAALILWIANFVVVPQGDGSTQGS